MKRRSSNDPDEAEQEESVPAAADNNTNNTNNDNDDGATPPPPPRFQPSQKVLARDSDGLLYIAYVRRVHYGQPHQLKLGILGTLECEEEETDLDALEESRSQPQWFYFMHFDGWKVNWDRWLQEKDIMEYTDHYVQWQRIIQQEHRVLMKQHKQPGKRVDGAEFLKAWKPKFEELMNMLQGGTNGKKKLGNGDRPQKKTRKVLNAQDLLEQEHAMRQHHLLSRSSTDREQIQLPSGLKRILVEEWEILTGPFGMVHDLDPNMSVRRVLDDYVQSKGVVTMRADSDVVSPAEPQLTVESTPMEDTNNSDDRYKQHAPVDQNVDENQKEIERRHKEWIDMENGICQLFDQALPTRLLYPREQVQLFAFIQDKTDSGISSSTPTRELSNYYGCAHLLRLCCQLPGLLSAQYDPNDDDLQQLVVRPMLAKMNDLLRFLQTNQERYFPQRFRRLTVDEEKLEQKWIKRYGRNQATAPSEATEEAEQD